MKAQSIMTGMAFWLAVGSVSYAETSTAPLPSMDTIIQRAIAAAQTEDDNNRAFNQHYYYTSASTKEFRNGDGDLKGQEKKQEVHDPLHKRAHKVAQPTAAPANASATATSGQASGDTKSSVHGKAFEKKDFLMNPDLLNRFDFTLQGRETINGRDALVIDFKPKSGKLPEHSLKERFINKAAGRVWIDEQEAQLVKADLYLTKRVDVFGGLVGSVYKCTCTISRERTDDGLWFTRSTGWHLEGREVFFRRTVDYHQDTSDVRRVR